MSKTAPSQTEESLALQSKISEGLHKAEERGSTRATQGGRSRLTQVGEWVGVEGAPAVLSRWLMAPKETFPMCSVS